MKGGGGMRTNCVGPGKDNDYKCKEFGEERYDNDGIYVTRCCDWCWHNKIGPKYKFYNNPDYHHDYLDAGEELDPEPEVGWR